MRQGTFGQLTQQQLIDKAAQCAQAGQGINLQTGECCTGMGCVEGYGGPPGPGTTTPTTLPTGHVIIEQSKLDQLTKERDDAKTARYLWAGGAALASFGVDALIGYAVGR